MAQTKAEKYAYNKKWRAENPERMKALRDKWFKENREYRRTYMKAYKARTYSKRYHGVDRATYLAMCERQQHLCAICQRKRRLVVDHCHETNIVRGLLCVPCNTGLGCFYDNVDLFQLAILYLQAPARLVSQADSPEPCPLFPLQGSSQSERV